MHLASSLSFALLLVVSFSSAIDLHHSTHRELSASTSLLHRMRAAEAKKSFPGLRDFVADILAKVENETHVAYDEFARNMRQCDRELPDLTGRVTRLEGEIASLRRAIAANEADLAGTPLEIRQERRVRVEAQSRVDAALAREMEWNTTMEMHVDAYRREMHDVHPLVDKIRHFIAVFTKLHAEAHGTNVSSESGGESEPVSSPSMSEPAPVVTPVQPSGSGSTSGSASGAGSGAGSAVSTSLTESQEDELEEKELASGDSEDESEPVSSASTGEPDEVDMSASGSSVSSASMGKPDEADSPATMFLELEQHIADSEPMDPTSLLQIATHLTHELEALLAARKDDSAEVSVNGVERILKLLHHLEKQLLFATAMLAHDESQSVQLRGERLRQFRDMYHADQLVVEAKKQTLKRLRALLRRAKADKPVLERRLKFDRIDLKITQDQLSTTQKRCEDQVWVYEKAHYRLHQQLLTLEATVDVLASHMTRKEREELAGMIGNVTLPELRFDQAGVAVTRLIHEVRVITGGGDKIGPCATNPCHPKSVCVAVKRVCSNTTSAKDCPQFRCDPLPERGDPCASDPCPRATKCVPQTPATATGGAYAAYECQPQLEAPKRDLGETMDSAFKPRTCADIYRRTRHKDKLENGMYTLHDPSDGLDFPAYCDMHTAGGGWTLAFKQSDFASASVLHSRDYRGAGSLLHAGFNETSQRSLLGYGRPKQLLFRSSLDKNWFVTPNIDGFQSWTPPHTPRLCLLRHNSRDGQAAFYASPDWDYTKMDFWVDANVELMLEPYPTISGITVGKFRVMQKAPQCGQPHCSVFRHGRFEGLCDDAKRGEGNWMIFTR